jgi:hypothetical protein
MARVPRRLTKGDPPATLSADEQHLLDAVDGVLGEEELAFITGKSPFELVATLEGW